MYLVWLSTSAENTPVGREGMFITGADSHTIEDFIRHAWVYVTQIFVHAFCIEMGFFLKWNNAGSFSFVGRM